MAIVDRETSSITDLAASPPVRLDVNQSGARLRVKSETISSVSTDSNGSVYRFFRVKAHDVIKSLVIFLDTQAASANTLDVGVYASELGAVVDIDAIAAAFVGNTAITVGTEIRFQALDITTVNDAIWENAGVSDEPVAGTEYDIAVTVKARGSTPATGDITMVIQYVSGD